MNKNWNDSEEYIWQKNITVLYTSINKDKDKDDQHFIIFIFVDFVGLTNPQNLKAPTICIFKRFK